MISEEKLAELKELAEKATPGPWITGAHRHAPSWVVLPPTEDSCGSCIAQCQIRVNGFNNAAFIAAANLAVVLEMIAEIERLAGEVERLDKEVDWLAERAGIMCRCLDCDDCELPNDCGGGKGAEGWRKAARKAVEGE